ncbi:MAG: hypothetical protein JW786_05325 [Desulfobacterales bacterium]|nr:hypothetical protein [Desulfobacterales bacterium]
MIKKDTKDAAASCRSRPAKARKAREQRPLYPRQIPKGVVLPVTSLAQN